MHKKHLSKTSSMHRQRRKQDSMETIKISGQPYFQNEGQPYLPNNACHKKNLLSLGKRPKTP